MPRYRLTVDLQDDFALDQPLSPFAVEVLDAFDPAAPEYALDAVSVIEATLDDPRAALAPQEFAARGEALAAMKQAGLDYEARMALLEDVTWPSPRGDPQPMLTTPREPPWAAEADSRRSRWCRPLGTSDGFAQFVRHYNLVRNEGWCCATLLPGAAPPFPRAPHSRAAGRH